MLCENCNNQHDGTFGKGRFCCRKCSAAFSTKSKRAEINEKLRSKAVERVLKYKEHPDQFASPIIFTKQTHEKTVISNKKRLIEKCLTKDWDSLGQRLKRSRILVDQNGRCNRCKIDNWLGKKLTLELDHKDGNNSNNSRDNLELLCPNCHSLTPTWRGRNKRLLAEKISDQEMINALETYPNIRQALKSLGVTDKGNNYKRAKRLKGL